MFGVAQQKNHESESTRRPAPEDSSPWLAGVSVALTEMSFLLQLPDQLPLLAAALFAGLLVEGGSLDVAGQPLLLARLLEALEELIETLVHPDLDADQTRTSQGS